jgi:glutathione-independent formaldehyde dehydrogenase
VTSNRAVVYQGPEQVAVESIAYPRLAWPGTGPGTGVLERACPRGAVLRVVASGICGSDQHIYRARSEARPGFVLGHEITGEVVEVGRDVELLQVGDLVSAPFTIACGSCRNCREGEIALCETVNPGGLGGAYGFPGLGPWLGGQSDYVLAPYAEHNLLRFPDRERAMDKILDLALLSDILPTGYHGALTAGVRPGSTVYIAGAGPVGLCAAISADLLGAALVVLGDVNPDRLAHAAALGWATADLSAETPLADQIEALAGLREVDAAVDCVGFMARGHGAASGQESAAAALDDVIDIARASAHIGIPGAYLTDARATGSAAEGMMTMRFTTSWGKSHVLHTGCCPAARYQRALMNSILFGRIEPARHVVATPVPLEDAPQAYRRFDSGAAVKYLLDPHGLLPGTAPLGDAP